MGKKVLKVEKLTSENGIIELEAGTQIIGGTVQQSTQWGAGTGDNTDIYYSTGDVGIGVSDPRFTLDVNGTANVGVLTTTSVSGDGSGLTDIPLSAIPNLNNSQWTTNGNNIYINNPSVQIGIARDNPDATLDVNGTVNATTLRATNIIGDGSGITNIQAVNVSGLNNSQWTTNGNDIYINNGGRVGLGTNDPGYTLDVNGTVNVGALTTTSVSGDGSGLTGIPASAVIGGVGVWTQPGNDIYYNTGNVSIGTTATGANLHVEGNVYVSSNLEVGTANLFVDTSTSNVGIGTSTPGYTLDVDGDINLTGVFYQDGLKFVSSLWTLNGDELTYTASNVEIGTANLFVNIENSNVGIGTSTPGYRLDVHGTANVGVLTTTSVSGDGSGLTALSALNVTTGLLDTLRIPDLPASKITSGTFPATQIPDLPASKITSGTFAQARIPLLSGVTGVFDPNVDAIKIGNGAGTTSQGTSAVAVGHDAGTTSQGDRAVALGSNAAVTNQGNNAVALGSNAAVTNQGNNAVAVGYEAGHTDQGTDTVAIGTLTGETSQGANAVAVGYVAGTTSQGGNAIAVGIQAGKTSQGISGIAIGNTAGETDQGANSIAVGTYSGQTSQGSYSVALGYYAGNTNQHNNSVILNASGGTLNSAGASRFYVKPIRDATEASNVVTYNATTGEVLDCNAFTVNTLGHVTAIKFLGDGSALQNLPSAGYNSAVDDIKIGNGAGTTSQGSNSVAVGHDAATTSQGTQATAVGYLAGNNNQGDKAVAVGVQAGVTSQGHNAIAVGWLSGNNTQGDNAVAVGYYAGNDTQGSNAVAVGIQAGQTSQGDNAVAIGRYSGQNNQGNKAVAVGYAAGLTDQHANSIILNASGVTLDSGGASRFYVKPIRAATEASNVVTYNATTGEVLDCKGITVNTLGHVTAIKILGDGSGLTALSALNVTTGLLDTLRIPDLPASKITSGTLPVTRGGTGTTTSTGTGSVVLSAAPAFSGDVAFDTNTLKIDSTNNRVGIGVTDPDGTLHVKADNRVHITTGTVPVFTGLRAPSEGRAQFVLSSSYSDLVIASSAVNDNHGSTLSFATVNPSNTAEYRKFVINQGNWGSRKDFLDFGLSASTSDANPHLSINSTDTVLTLDGNNKRVGIGTNTPSYALDVVGDIYASGDVIMFSDERKKTDIEVIPNALEKVLQLRGVTFNKLDDDNRRHSGIIAQEVEKVLPEVVYTDKDGLKSVAYGNMIGLLIEAIKELTGK